MTISKRPIEKMVSVIIVNLIPIMNANHFSTLSIYLRTYHKPNMSD